MWVRRPLHVVVPAKAGTHTPCPLDWLRRMGPGATAGTTEMCACPTAFAGTTAWRGVGVGASAKVLFAPGILDGGPHPNRRCRHVDVVDAEFLERVDERIDHRGRRRGDAAFATTLDAERV